MKILTPLCIIAGLIVYIINLHNVGFFVFIFFSIAIILITEHNYIRKKRVPKLVDYNDSVTKVVLVYLGILVVIINIVLTDRGHSYIVETHNDICVQILHCDMLEDKD